MKLDGARSPKSLTQKGLFCRLPGEASGQKPEMSDEQPSNFGGGRAFEVFGKTAASAEPGKGTFDDPTAWQ
jgi:hypothetical protein